MSASPTLPPEEQEQTLQTIEMFEVIVQANPHDCQSMEILKEAYTRLGMKKETMAMLQKLATAHVELGEFSSAMLEYESLLQLDPDNPQIVAAMSEVEEQMTAAARNKNAPTPTPGINLDFRAVVADTGTLMTTPSTMRPEGFAVGGARADEVAATLIEDGNDALAKFLIQNRLVGEELVQSMLARVHKKNAGLTPDQLGASLIDEIVRRGGGDLEALLSGILDRTKFAYVPLEYYEIDRQVVKMLPETITLHRLMVPFDVMSRTLMIATANPFDAPGKQAVQQLLDYSIQWHLASPQAIMKVLSEAYRIGGMKSIASVAAPAPAAAAAEAAAPAETEALPDTGTFRLAK